MRSVNVQTKIVVVTASVLHLSRFHSCDAFHVPTSFIARSPSNGLDAYRSSTNTILFQATNDINTDESKPSSSRRKRRVRKKDDTSITVDSESTKEDEDIVAVTQQAASQVVAEPQQQKEKTVAEVTDQQPPTTETKISLKPRKESRVAMKVRDVREVTNIGIVEPTKSEATRDNTILSSLPFFNKGDKEKQQSTMPTSSPKSITDDNLDYDEMDPIQRLLYDAKQMQKEESGRANDDSGSNKAVSTDDDDGSIGSRIRSIISTIVTVDFFVVCAFLLWFLAGIFASVVLKVRIQITYSSDYIFASSPFLP